MRKILQKHIEIERNYEGRSNLLFSYCSQENGTAEKVVIVRRKERKML
jgi:hypothetical protein